MPVFNSSIYRYLMLYL